MKTFMLFMLLGLQTAFGEGVLLKSDLDPRELALPQGYKLWSDIQAEKMKSRNLREEIMSSSTLFLENRISTQDYAQLLRSWAESGFSQQERIVLIDTLQKSSMKTETKNQWLCRLDSERNCARIRIFSKHLAPLLQKYDWLIVDGQVYPRVAWDEISIADESMSWTFLSARFETYNFKGKWEDLKFKNPNLANWVTGDCDHYSVSGEVQAMDNQVLLNRSCLKPTVFAAPQEKSFYEKNKTAIWIAAGVVVGGGLVHSLSNKNIVIEKPSFR